MGQLQATLVKKLSVLDKYEHVLAQVNSVSMERLIDPKTQVRSHSPILWIQDPHSHTLDPRSRNETESFSPGKYSVSV